MDNFPPKNIEIIQAEPKNFPMLLQFDPLIEKVLGRYDAHKHSIDNGNTYFALEDGELRGFLLFNYQLYGHGFIELIVIGENFRGQGLGTKLIHYAESICKTDKIFISTNKSNDVMQGLLKKIGYKASGHVENINDEDRDHEEFFVKFLNQKK